MAETPPRYCPDRQLPPYSYVTGLFPHPTRDERGHSFGRYEEPPAPLDEANYRTNAAYLCGLDLFNHGFYWEAHEAWEALWHAAGRHGPTADFLKALIKLSAAGVKLREGRPAGVRQHAERAAALLRNLSSALQRVFGLNRTGLMAAALAIAEQAEALSAESQPDASRRLPHILVFDD